MNTQRRRLFRVSRWDQGNGINGYCLVHVQSGAHVICTVRSLRLLAVIVRLISPLPISQHGKGISSLEFRHDPDVRRVLEFVCPHDI